MSKPQWIRASQEDYERLADAHSVALREMEQLRAALAAAEAKLADCRQSVKVCDVCGEETSTWEGHALKAALADERRHANALYECLRELSGPCEYPEHCARYKHHRCRSCSEAKLIDPLLAAHTARRAANAPLSDAGASSEVANGTA